MVTALNTYIDGEAIRYKGRNQTRYNAMQQDAHGFANGLIGRELTAEQNKEPSEQ